MLDVKFIVQNAERVRKAIRDKNQKRDDVDEICTLYEERKSLQQDIDKGRMEVKELSKAYGQAKKKGEDKPELKEQSIQAGERVKEKEA